MASHTREEQKRGTPSVILPFAQEVAKYFMDFLETDFHKRRTPKRSIRLRSEDNLLVGVNLRKYPRFVEVIWKSLRKGFADTTVRTITKQEYRANVPQSLLELVRKQVERLTEEQLSVTVKAIASQVVASAQRFRLNIDEALTSAFDDASSTLRATLVASFIDERLEQPLKSLSLGDEDTLYTLGDELTQVLLKLIEPVISDCITQLILEEPVDVCIHLSEAFTLSVVRSNIIDFFSFLQVGDLFAEINEIERNRKILDKQEFYLNLFEISYKGTKYPVFYLPVEVTVQDDAVTLEFDSRVFINKKALSYIVQEFNAETGHAGTLASVSNRILYLSQHEDEFIALITTVINEIANFFNLSGSADLFNATVSLNVLQPEQQEVRSQLVRLSNFCYLSLFDKSDEALVNDYEDILQELELEGSPIAEAFCELIRGFVFDNPTPFTREVEKEWYDLETADRLVYSSPIPLNSEQRQILAAIQRDGCRFITVEGPPGTGKSHTITAIVCDAVLNGKSVLVLSDKKEALDVVEDKIADTMNRVRIDHKFQNPILRLGKTGSSYKQILSPTSINGIKTHYRAVDQESVKLENSIGSLDRALKSGLQAEIAAYCDVDLSDIRQHTELEQHFDGMPLIDVEEALSSPEFAVDLDEFRSILLEMRELLFDNEPSSRLLEEIIGSSIGCMSRVDELEESLLHVEELVRIADSIMSTNADLLEFLCGFETFNSASLITLEELMQSYTSLRNPYFGYLFKGGALKQLDAKFMQAFPTCGLSTAHKHLNDLSRMRSIYRGVLQSRKKIVSKLLSGIDYVDGAHILVTNQDASELATEIAAFAPHLDRLKATFRQYPDSLTMCGFSISDLGTCTRNRLVDMDDDEFSRLIRYICLKQKVTTGFENVPDSNYVELKGNLESLVTTKMTYLLDGKVLDFCEREKGTAKTLSRMITKKERFPKEQFPSLQSAFPCILSGIRDYAEYIPLESDLFDLVIIDEASQVTVAQAFPALLRARKVLVLGDKKQFSNVKAANARSATNREYLNRLRDVFIRQVSNDVFDKTRLEYFDIKHSILEFFEFITNCDISLLKHFRCYKEIIGYSKKYFYDSSLQVLKITGKPIDEVIRFTYVENELQEPVANTNRTEVETIISELHALKDSRYTGSVGVITPHTNQQKLISEIIKDLPDRDFFYNDMRLKVMTFDTCQGEERDIIFYSMVASPVCDHLYGVFPRDLDTIEDSDGKVRVQRLNVGFSRAKECIHFILSKPVEEFKGAIGDALKHYKRVAEEARSEPLPDSTDPTSKMEPEVLNWITQTEFWQRNNAEHRVSLMPQFPIGEYLRQLDPRYEHPRYVVDFLLIYREEDGREHKIILEYDGVHSGHFDPGADIDEFNYANYYTGAHLEREKVIESYGPRFIRINRFNMGKNPVTTLNQRIIDAVSIKPDAPSLLRLIHKTVNGLQNGNSKTCPKCGLTKENEKFRDPSLAACLRIPRYVGEFPNCGVALAAFR